MADIQTVAKTNILDFWRLRLNEVIARINAFGESANAVITGGAINNTTIGAATPSTGQFTNLTVTSTANLSGATLLLANDSISGDKIDGGAASVNTLTLSSAPTVDGHATRKSYVDAAIQAESADLFARIVILGI